MAFVGLLITIVLVACVLGLIIHLTRTHSRVMDYHDIETPRVNPMNHGGGAA